MLEQFFLVHWHCYSIKEDRTTAIYSRCKTDNFYGYKYVHAIQIKAPKYIRNYRQKIKPDIDDIYTVLIPKQLKNQKNT
jgi:hypothetical protein